MTTDAKTFAATVEGDLTQDDKLETEMGSPQPEEDRISAETLSEPSEVVVEPQEATSLDHNEPLSPQGTTQTLEEEASSAPAVMDDLPVVMQGSEEQESNEATAAEVPQPTLSPDVPDDASIASTPPTEPERQAEELNPEDMVVEPDVSAPEPLVAPERPDTEEPAVTDLAEPTEQTNNLTSPLPGTVVDDNKLPPGLALDTPTSANLDAANHDEKDQASNEDVTVMEPGDRTPSRSQTPCEMDTAPLAVEDVSMSDPPAPSTLTEEASVTEAVLPSPAAEEPFLPEQSIAPQLSLVPPTPNVHAFNQSNTQPSGIIESYPASLSTPQFSAARNAAIRNYHAQYPSTQTTPRRFDDLASPAYPFPASIYPALSSEQTAVAGPSEQEGKADSALLLEAVAESDPFKLMGTDKHFFPGEAHNDGPDVGEASTSSGDATPQIDRDMKYVLVCGTSYLR
jgi:hypothetical protein